MIWPSDKSSPSSFKLVHQFSLAAAITIAASMGLLAIAISQRIEASMLRTAAEEGALFTEVFLGPSAQDLGTARRMSAESVRKLDELLAGKLGDRVRSVKIWLPDATLVYSTSNGPLGERFPSPHITAAVAGKATGEFDQLNDAENTAEKQESIPLVEIYAPLFRTGTRQVIAVGEVYTDGRRLAADLFWIKLTSIGIVGAVSAPMMIVLFLMIRRASNLVSAYQSSLIRNAIEANNLAAQNERLRRAADDARFEAANSNENLLARIGQDLHDGPIQLVSLLMLKITAPAAPKSDASGDGRAHDLTVVALTERILTELRNISTGLVLPELQGLTPNEILLLAVRNHEETTGTKVSRQIGDLPVDIPLPVTICLYRIVQEGLNNAFRHGKAIEQRVEVQVCDRTIVIAVSDRGPGFFDGHQERSPKRGLGVAGLRNRVEALKGTFEFISRGDVGTQIRAALPIS
ncbi:ATP-binding protein [Bradyrhizobium lablabi]|uniref:sensor histidine kinase n=1 Tax=Bradyrhizobium lablabi TaxID=722472 RepID=UPI001BAD6FCC|nr:ATP-binding protein [Bradyrhizobium lablabi]MBR1123477.1 ATP-binding protein [Bradyrhizobium lablabi]